MGSLMTLNTFYAQLAEVCSSRPENLERQSQLAEISDRKLLRGKRTELPVNSSVPRDLWAQKKLLFFLALLRHRRGAQKYVASL
jgi:hypothetical protein